MSDGPIVKPLKPSLLISYRDKLEAVETTEHFMESNFTKYQQRTNGMSEKEICDMLLTCRKEDSEMFHYGLLFGILTNKEHSAKYFNQLATVASRDQWYTCGYALNIVINELMIKLLPEPREQFIFIFRECIKNNVHKAEEVIAKFLKNLNDSMPSVEIRLKLVTAVADLLMKSHTWLVQLKYKSSIYVTATYTFGRYAAEISMGGPNEEARKVLTGAFVWMIRNRFPDIAHVGRDLVLLLMRMGKAPEIQQLWKDMLYNPTVFAAEFKDIYEKMSVDAYTRHVVHLGVEELWFRPPSLTLTANRLSNQLEKKVLFLLRTRPGTTPYHFQWFEDTHLRVDDQGSLRAEVARFVLFTTPNEPFLPETRNQLLTNLIVRAAPNSPESQWLKMCLWADWLGFDPNINLQNTAPHVHLEATWNLVRYTLSSSAANMVLIGNSLLEFLVKSAAVVHPPWKERTYRSMVHACRLIYLLAPPGQSQQAAVSTVIDSHRIERSYKEQLREIFKEFLRTADPVAPQQSSIGVPTPTSIAHTPPATPTASPSASPAHPSSSVRKADVALDEEDDDDLVVVKESAPAAARVLKRELSTEAVQKNEEELASLLASLGEEVKPGVEKFKDIFENSDNDGDRAEGLQELIAFILNNDSVIDVEQLEIVSQCIAAIMGDIVTPGVSVLPDPITQDALQEAFESPLYVLFRNLTLTPQGDHGSRNPLVTIIGELRETISCVTYLLLYFLKSGTTKDAIDSGIDAYLEVVNALDKDVDTQLIEDLDECATNDIRLFAHLIPFVFAKFPMEATSSGELFHTIVKHMDASHVWMLFSEMIRENVALFRKDTFPSIVQASLGWDSMEQFVFWQLVHAEGVTIDWCTNMIGRISSTQNPEAASNILLMLKRIDREPNMGLMRAILQRQPDENDDMVVNAIRILIEDSDVCEKVAEILQNIIKKQIQDQTFMMPPKGKLKTSMKLPMEQVLAHLQHFSQKCLAKESKNAEALLGKPSMRDAFQQIKKCDKGPGSILLKRYSELITFVDIYSSDMDAQPARTLRGNRQAKTAANLANKRELRALEEDQPKTKRSKVVIVDSDSDD